MIKGFCASIVCIALLVAGTGKAVAHHLDTQPSPPFANSPFVALVDWGEQFDSNAGFDPTTLRVQGNTIFVDFFLCLTTCSYIPTTAPFPLQLPALPPGDYTLEVGVVGFSPNPPPQTFPFSVSAIAAPVVSLPALSTWSLACLLAGLIFVTLRAMRRRAPIRY